MKKFFAYARFFMYIPNWNNPTDESSLGDDPLKMSLWN
jgi:hypothetical protein